MQFNSLYEYIDQTYDVQLDKEFLKKEAPGLTYVKLVRVLSQLRISVVGMTADQLFFEAVRYERNLIGQEQKRLELMFQLADLHEIIETLIRKSGKKSNDQFDDNLFAQDINS
jgi:hypothetical protein